MAELLIQAKKHWRDDTDPSEIADMNDHDKEDFDRRTQIGDVIVVKPDGWIWGKKETLPDFVVVKIPGMSVEDAKIYAQSLEQNGRTIRNCRYRIKKSVIQKAVRDNDTEIIMDTPRLALDLEDKNGRPD